MEQNSSPTIAPSSPISSDRVSDYWQHFDSSINAVSFGFVATAILISMFLVMAIFERFLRQASSHPNLGELEGKLSHPSPKITTYANGVSVLMPGEEIPTFIAHHAPAPCAPERFSSSITNQSQEDVHMYIDGERVRFGNTGRAVLDQSDALGQVDHRFSLLIFFFQGVEQMNSPKTYSSLQLIHQICILLWWSLLSEALHKIQPTATSARADHGC